MTIKAYDGTTWQTQKSLKIYDGSSWATAKQAWIFNGSSWVINYPEYPSNTAAPSISTSSGIAGRIGCVYAVSVGSWNSNDAYNPTSYSYQWTRSGSDISGATNGTYTTGYDDVEKIIGCRVTATNFRGNTPSSATTGVTMLPQVTSISVTDYTSTPNAPSSVSISNTGLSYSGSWTTIDSVSTYFEAIGGGTAGTPSINSAAKTFSGTGTAGSASVSIRGVNTNKQLYINWGSSVGAISYDLYINGSFYTNTGTNNYYIYTAPDENARTFSVYPRSTNNQGYGIQYGTAVAATTKYSAYTTSSTITLSNPIPINTSAPTLSPTGGYVAGQTLTYGVGSWSNSPTSYDLRLYRGTPGVVMSETLVAAPGNTTSSTYTIPASDYDGSNRYYYRSFASATNSGGTSGYTAGTEGGPLAQPVVIPSGGSAFLSGGVSTGSTLSASTSGWSGSPTSYFIKITRGTQNVASYETTVASSYSTSTSYTVAASDAGYYFKAFATASNSAGSSSEVASGELGPATNPVTVTKPTISVSNSYASVSGTPTWTLSMTHTGGSVPTSYDWGIQFSNSNGGSVLASNTGSGTWTAGSGGTQTVTRNSSTYSWARWVTVTASNSAGTSTAQSTSWA
ncbi:MAG: hypothetical protein EBQ94_09515 [Flavobacteriales bacterium]|nr:hypothetical protein [Flavobacteriales bacterium]